MDDGRGRCERRTGGVPALRRCRGGRRVLLVVRPRARQRRRGADARAGRRPRRPRSRAGRALAASRRGGARARATRGRRARAPDAPDAPFPPTPLPRGGRGEWSIEGVRGLLLWLGVALLALSAVTFTVVTWSRLGDGGRAAVLVGATIAVTALAVACRRRLPSTAEALSALAVTIAAIDWHALRRAGVGAHLSGTAWWAIGAVVLGGMAALIARFVSRRTGHAGHGDRVPDLRRAGRRHARARAVERRARSRAGRLRDRGRARGAPPLDHAAHGRAAGGRGRRGVGRGRRRGDDRGRRHARRSATRSLRRP